MRALPSIVFVYDRKKKSGPSQTGIVELRITFERVRKYMSTGVKLLPREWKGGKNGIWVTNRTDAQDLNKTLDTFMANVRKAANAIMERDGAFTFTAFEIQLKLCGSSQMRFIDFCVKRAEIRKYGKKKDTQERYERFLRWFIEWGKIEHFSDITDANIIAMDEALIAMNMKNYSKWQNYHRFLDAFIRDAMQEGYVRRNPYKWLFIARDQDSGLQKYLTFEEFKRIEEAKMPTLSLERVRDVFVFQTYTCMAYTDLCDFDVSQIKGGMYTGNRGKTGQEFSFLLMEPALAILDKYNNALPIISNKNYNEYLKLVAHAAKVDKPLTSHWARHTGATILLNEGGVDMEVVAKVLGDTVEQVRRTYAKLLDKTVAHAMSQAQEKLR